MRIHAIQTGTVMVKERQRHGAGPGPTRVLRTMFAREWTEPLPILAWLVEHEEGLILVDTGDTARTAERGWFPWWQPYFRLAVRIEVTAHQEVGPQIESLGHSPGDVRWTVMTHLHTDHAGGLHHVASSEVLVTPREWADAAGLKGKLRGYLPHRLPPGLEPTQVEFDAQPFGPFTHSKPLTKAGDVVLLPTPGHTPGHMSVAVRTGGRTVLLAGDTSYTEQLMLDGVADGVTNDPAASLETLARIRALDDLVYLPTHDPGSAARLEAALS